MPADVFRQRMDDEIDAKFSRARRHRRGEGAVARMQRTGGFCDGADRRKISEAHQRIHRVSVWMSFVFGRIAAASASRSLMSTSEISMPNRGSVSRANSATPA